MDLTLHLVKHKPNGLGVIFDKSKYQHDRFTRVFFKLSGFCEKECCESRDLRMKLQKIGAREIKYGGSRRTRLIESSHILTARRHDRHPTHKVVKFQVISVDLRNIISASTDLQSSDFTLLYKMAAASQHLYQAFRAWWVYAGYSELGSLGGQDSPKIIEIENHFKEACAELRDLGNPIDLNLKGAFGLSYKKPLNQTASGFTNLDAVIDKTTKASTCDIRSLLRSSWFNEWKASKLLGSDNFIDSMSFAVKFGLREKPTAGGNYEPLSSILRNAFDRAAKTKGVKRHAEEGEDFTKQQIFEINRRLYNHPAAGFLFQVVKKVYESGRLEGEARENEILDAIVYAAAAVIFLREKEAKK